MDINKILSAVDHTQLSITATYDDITKLCNEAIKYGTASVCIPPCHVKQACEYVGSRMRICTVVGFPCGYNSSAVKAFETSCALEDGAHEIDMVINVGKLKDSDYSYVGSEIEQIKSLCQDKILKVIIETCLLTRAEKVAMCEIVSASGADFIKTSTGFSTGGANVEDILLFKEHLSPHVKIKAAGGISTLEDAQHFLLAGASRLGTSRIVKLVQKGTNENELSDAAY